MKIEKILLNIVLYKCEINQGTTVSSIGSNYQIHHIPRINGQSKGAKAAEIKMEIAKVKQQVRAGQISQEEAQQKLAMLEAKLARIQQGVEPDNQPVQASESVNFNAEVKTLDNVQPSHNESENNNPDAQQRQDSQDAFFVQQALYNRAFHHI